MPGITEIVLLFAATLVSATEIQSQPEIEWQKNFGTTRNPAKNNFATPSFWSEGLIGTPDNGCLLFGVYYDTKRNDYTAALKLDSSGAIQWFAEPMRRRGKTLKRGMNAFRHSNGDFILTGTYETNGGYWVACISEDGKVKWDTTHRLEGFSYSLIEGPNGEIITANDTATGLRLRRYKPDGQILWNKIYPVRNRPFEWNQNLQVVDGRLSMVCTYNEEPQLCRFSSSLDTFELSPLDFDPGNNLNFTLVRPPDGGFLFLDGEEGYDYTKHSNWSIAEIKRFDQQGSLIFEKHQLLGDRGNILLKGAYVLPDQNLIVSGTAQQGEQEYFLMRLDEKGDTLWTSFYPTGERHEFFMKSTQMADGGVIFLGSERLRKETWLIRIKSSPALLPSERKKSGGLLKRIGGWLLPW